MKDYIEHKGQKYISTKKAASLSGFTADYVGQLARSSKIRSKLIGKTRFVSERDLMEYGRRSDFTVNGEKYISTKDAAELTGYAQDYIGQVAHKGLVASKIVGRTRFVLEDDVVAYAKTNRGPESVKPKQVEAGAPVISETIRAVEETEVPTDIISDTGSIVYREEEGLVMPELAKPVVEVEESVEAEVEVNVPSIAQKILSTEVYVPRLNSLHARKFATAVMVLAVTVASFGFYNNPRVAQAALEGIRDFASESAKITYFALEAVKEEVSEKGLTRTISDSVVYTKNEALEVKEQVSKYAGGTSRTIGFTIEEIPNTLSGAVDSAVLSVSGATKNVVEVGPKRVTAAIYHADGVIGKASIKVYKTVRCWFNDCDEGGHYAVNRSLDAARERLLADRRVDLDINIDASTNVIGEGEGVRVTPVNSVVVQGTTRVIERVVEVTDTNAITSAELELRLQQLENKIRGEVLTQDYNPTVINNYQTIAHMNRIDKLTGVDINNPTITDGTITNTELSGVTITSSSFGGTTVTTTGDVTVGGQLTVSGTATSTIAGDVAFDSNTLYIDSINNRVGVGTTSPFTDFSVVGDGYFSGSVTANSVTLSSAGADMLISTDSSGVLVSTSTPSVASIIATSTTATSTFAGGLTVDGTDFVVDPDAGRVGIGTSSPAYLLDVAGSGRFASHLYLDDDSGDSPVLRLSEGGGGDGDLRMDSDGYFIISTSKSGDDIVLSPNAGNVGIGTTSPYAALSVVGETVATNFSATSTTATSTFSGNLSVLGNTSIGDATSDFVSITASVSSNFIPDANNARDIGSASRYWANGYFDTFTANTISAASTTIAGTQSATFTLNTDNATADTEDMDLIFFRGTASPNALLSWNSTLDLFDFNQPLFIQNDNSTTTIVTLDLKGTASQTADLFRVSDSSGTNLFNVGSGGNVGIGTTTPFTDFSVAGSGFFNESLTASNITATGTLGVTGAATLSSTLDVTGAATTTGKLSSYSFVEAPYFVATSTSATNSLLVPLVNDATTPSIAFGDGDTGFYESADDTLAISIAGNLRGIWTDGGLRMGATGAFAGVQANEISSATNPVFVTQNGDGDTGIGGDGSDTLSLITGGSSALYVDSSQRVGIGTTTPSGILDVYSATGPDVYFGAAVAAGSNAGRLRFNNNQTVTSEVIGGIETNATSGNLQFWTSNSGTRAERARIDSSGNFGIGTTSPTTLLTVGSTTPNSIASTNYYNSAFVSGDLEVDGTIYAGTIAGGSDYSNMVASFDASGNLVPTSTPSVASLTATSTTATSTFAGVVQFADGTQSFPGISFTSDTNTGFWNNGGDAIGVALGGGNYWTFQTSGFTPGSATRPSLLYEASSATNPNIIPQRDDADTGIGGDGSDTLSLITGGSSAVYVDSSQRVGIGTTSPTRELEIGDGSGSPDILLNKSTSGSSYLYFYNDANPKAWVGIDGDEHLRFGVNNTERMAILESGFVGIGDTTPTYKLDVTGNARFTSLVDASHFVSTSTTATSTFAGGLTVDSTDFVVDPDAGRVGIGTASPEDQLHVYDSTTNDADLKIESDHNSAAARLLIDVNSSSAQGNQILFQENGSNVGRVEYDNENSLLELNNSATSQNHLVIDTGGNVGLGTSTPSGQFNISASDGSGKRLRFTGANSTTRRNWQIATQDNIDDTFEITPSTANGGLTFSSPAIAIKGSTSYVGIGDSSPTYRLDVSGDARFTSLVDASHFVATSTTATSTFAGGLTVDSTDLVVDPDGGRVGIGTASPTQELDVVGDIQLSNELYLATNNKGIIAKDSGSSNRDLLKLDSSNRVQIGSSALSGDTLFMQTGNVGIGTTSPTGKLTVDGGNIILNGTDTNRLLLPLRNTAATPTVAFGDGDTGIFEDQDDSLAVAIGGTQMFRLRSGGLDLNSSAGPTLLRETSSLTNPTLVPYLDDVDTGVGANGSNSLSLVTGGTAAITIDSSQNSAFDGKVSIEGAAATYALNVLGQSQFYTATSDDIILAKVTADSTHRFSVSTEGLIQWGPGGSTARDTNLYRDSANVLKTDDDFIIAGAATTTGKFTTYGFIEAPYFVATSTTATSTFAGGLTVDSTDFVVDPDGGLVGIGTASPDEALTLGSGKNIKLQENSKIIWNTNDAVFQSNFSSPRFEYHSSGGENWAFARVGSDVVFENTTAGNGYNIVIDSDNDIKFRDNGTEYAGIYSGNFGIGTTTPSADLDVFGFSRNLAQTTISAPSTGKGIEYVYRADGSNDFGLIQAYDRDASSFKDLRLSANSFALTQGNVGIGTTTPQELLHVYRNTSNTDQQALIEEDGAGDASLGFRETGGQDWVIGLDNSDGNSFKIKPSTDLNSGNGLKISTGGDVTLGASIDVTQSATAANFIADSATATSTFAGGLTVDSTDFVVDPDGGRVGIGTASPEQALHISGGYLQLDNNRGIKIDNAAGTASTVFEVDSGDNVAIGSTAMDDIRFHNAAGATHVVIQEGGNFGIATSSPWGLLSVNPSGISGPSFAIGSSTQTDFVVTNGGLVGIGTANPQGPLDVILNGSGTNGAIFGSASVFTGIRSDNALYFDGTDNLNIRNCTNRQGQSGCSEIIRFTDSGNVGVGTNDPQARFEIEDNNSGNPITKITADDHNVWGLVIGNDTVSATDTNGLRMRVTNSGPAEIESTQGNLLLSSNVGIGTSTSASTLHVLTADAGDVTADTNADDLVIENSGRGGLSILTPDASNSELIFGSPTDNFGFQINWNHDSDIAKIQTRNAGASMMFGTADGTEAMRIDSSQNVGIGTTTPTQILSLGSATDTFLLIDSTHAGGDSRIQFTNSGDATYPVQMGRDDDGVFRFYHDGGTTYAIDTSKNLTYSGGEAYFTGGDVGIGTASPQRGLHYENNTPAFRISDANSSSAATASPYIEFYDRNNSNSVGNIGWESSSTGDLYIRNSVSSSNILFYNTSEVMRIDSSGNVGIGTTSPYKLLSVAGDAVFDGTLTVTTLSATTSISAPYFTATDASATSTFAGGLTVDSTDFVVDPDGGRVGIGTASPVQELHIEGAVANNQFLFDSTDGSLGFSAKVADGSGTTIFQLNEIGGDAGRLILRDGGSVRADIEADGDSTLGLYDIGGTIDVSLNTNGSSYFNGGNVGIGTASPGYKLEVSDAGAPSVAATDTTNTLTTRIRSTDSVGEVGTVTNHPVNIVSNNTAAITVDTSQNVGIGTTSPGSALEVVAAGGSDFITLNSESAAGNPYFAFEQDSVRKSYVQHLDSGDTLLLDSESGAFQVNVGSAHNALHIDSSGNVGIGTTSPDTKLHVETTTGSEALTIHNSTTGQDLFVSYSNSGNAGLNWYDSSGNIDIRMDVNADSYVRNGNFGIGTASPTVTHGSGLHIAGTNAGIKIDATASGGLGYIEFEDEGSTVHYSIGYRDVDNSFRIGTSDLVTNTRVTIDSSGNVGVGTTSPSELFSVTSSGGDSAYFVGEVGIGLNNPDDELHLKDWNSDSNPGLSIENDARRWRLRVVGGDGDRFAIRDASGTGDLVTVLTSANNGYMGIGTTSPQNLLHIDGPSDGTGYLRITDSETGSTASDGARIGFNSTHFRIQNYENTNMSFFVNNSTEAITIDNTGNVGIGTTTPTNTLHVVTADAGDITADTGSDDLVVENSGNGGISLLQPDANVGKIAWGAPSDSIGAIIQYGHNSGVMQIGPAKVGGSLSLRGDNDITNLTLSGASGSERATFAGEVSIPATEELFFDGGGNTYITEGAGDNLDVYAGGTHAIRFADNHVATQSGIDFRLNPTNSLYFDGGGNTYISEVSADKLRITAGGNTMVEFDGTGTINATFASRIYIPDGSSSVPAIAFSGDTDTGIYRSAANTIDFLNGGSRSVTIDGSGNVGIGTTSPGTTLDVNEEHTTTSFTGISDAAIWTSNYDTTGSTNHWSGIGFRVADTGGNGRSAAGIFAAKEQEWTTTASTRDAALVFSTNLNGSLSEKMRIDSSGNVGIGTTSPANIFEIYGSGNTVDLIVQDAQGTTAANPSIELWDSTSEIGRLGFSSAANNDLDIANFVSGADIYLTTTGAGDVIVDNGNVGIGTASPGGLLEIEGSAAADVGIRLDNTAAGGEEFGLHAGVPASTNIGFSIYNHDDARTDLRIDGDGNVGIGTTTPAGKFAVAAPASSGNTAFYVDLVDNTADVVKIAQGGNSYLSMSTINGSEAITIGNTGTDADLIFDSDGNVGIGTTTPDTALTVADTGQQLKLTYSAGNFVTLGSNSSGSFNITTTSGDTNLGFNGGVNNRLRIYDSGNNADVDIQTSGNSYFNGGNVGIGAASPVQLLQISGASDPALSITDSTNGETVTDGLLLQQNNANTYMWNYENGNFFIGVDGSTDLTIETGGQIGIGDTSPDAQLEIVDFGSDILHISSDTGNDGDYLTVDTSGNVGIGDDSPDYILDVEKAQNGNTTVNILNSTDGASAVSRFLATSNAGSAAFVATSPSYTDVTSAGDALMINANNLSGGTVFAVDGVVKQIFDSSGNVGIGTTSPSVKLTIDGSGGAAGSLLGHIELGRGTNNRFRISTIRDAADNDAGGLAFGLGATEYMRIDEGGNVGIGTTSPDALFHVDGGNAVFGTGTGVYTGTSLNSVNVNAELYPAIGMYAAYGNTATANIIGYTNNLYLNQPNGGRISLNTNGTERFTVASDGKVGIGTTTPDVALNVYATATDANGAIVKINGTTASGGLGFFESGTVRGVIGYSDSGILTGGLTNSLNLRSEAALHFGSGGNGLAMTIDTSQNVGIGTTSPGSLFDIAGNWESAGFWKVQASDETLAGYIGDGVNMGGGDTNDLVVRGADEVHVNTNNSSTASVVVNSSGNVGIGETAPSELLHVREQNGQGDPTFDSPVVAIFQRNNGGSDVAIDLIGANNANSTLNFGDADDDNVGNINYNHTSDIMSFRTGAVSNRMVIDSSGYVGIGTTTPIGRLHVTGHATNPLTTEQTIPAVYLLDSESGQDSFMWYVDGAKMHIGDIDASNAYSPSTANTNERLTIDGSGNVGIGETSPQTRFHLETGSPDFGEGMTLYHDSSSDGRYITLNFGADNTYNPKAAIAFRSDGGTYGTGDLLFAVDPTDDSGSVAAGNEVMRITKGARVGINHSSPNAQLHVGDASAEGDATNPAIQIGGPTNYRLGFYTTAEGAVISNANGDDGIIFDTKAASEAMRITSAGDLGIGTTSPNILSNQRALTIQSTGATFLEIAGNKTTDDGVGGIAFFNDSVRRAQINAKRIDENDSMELAFLTSNAGSLSQAMVIAKDGNIGIGTTTPGSLLAVDGGQLTIENTSSTALTTGIELVNDAGTLGTGVEIRMRHANTANYVSIGEQIVSGGNPEMFFTIKGTEAMRIDQNRNVGIGTSTPQHAFVIEDSLPRIQLTSSGTTGASEIFLGDAGNGAIGSIRYEHGIDGLDFYTNSSKQLSIDSSGNVGIGDSSPDYTLDVAGNMGIDEYLYHNGDSDTYMRWEDNQLSLFVEGGAGSTGSHITLANDGSQTLAASDYISFNPGNSEKWRMDSSTFTSGGNTPVAIGGTPGDANFIEVGPGYINFARDDTVAAKHITFGKNGSVHSGISTDTNGFNIFGSDGNVDVTVDGSGNVGIGTASPDYRLDVNVNTGSTFAAHVDQDASTGYGLLITGGSTDSHPVIRAQSAAGGDVMWVGAGGNVGIGDETSPGALLDIGNQQPGVDTFSELITAQSFSTTWADAFGVHQIYDASTVDHFYLMGADTPAGTYASPTFAAANARAGFGMHLDRDGDEYLRFFSVASGGTAQSPSYIMSLGDTGNVGIGTTDPSTTLTVEKADLTEPFTIFRDNAAVDGTRVVMGFRLDHSGGASQGTVAGAIGAEAEGTWASTSSTRDASLVFHPVLDGSTYEAMRIDSAGRVGIGTDTPGNLLDVYRDNSNDVSAETMLEIEQDGGGDASLGWTLTGATNWYAYVDNSDSDKWKVRRSSSDFLAIDSIGQVLPGSDDTQNLGSSSLHWSCLYYDATNLGTCSSDAGLKSNIENFEFDNALEKLTSLQAREFTWNDDPSQKTNYGFVAQEVETIAPELVTVDDDGYKAVRYGYLQYLTMDAVEDIVNILDITDAPTTTPSMHIDSMGRIGVGTSTPSYDLHVEGEIAAQSFVNISTRDEKEDIEYYDDSDYADALETVKGLKVATYNYKDIDEEYKNEEETQYLGLIAEETPEEVLSLDGKGVDIYKLSTLTLSAVKALDVRLSAIEAQIAAGIAQELESGSIIDSVLAYFEGLGVKIANGFATFKNLAADTFKVGTAEKPAGITLYDEVTGSPYCLVIRNGAMVSSAGECSVVEVEDNQEENTEVASLAPTMTINGANPANVFLNATYLDQGVEVVDTVTGFELGYKTYLDGVEVSEINIDTSTSTTYMITYEATSQDGVVATVEREIIVGGSVQEEQVAQEEVVEESESDEVTQEEVIEEEQSEEIVQEEAVEEGSSEEVATEEEVNEENTEETATEVNETTETTASEEDEQTTT